MTLEVVVGQCDGRWGLYFRDWEMYFEIPSHDIELLGSSLGITKPELLGENNSLRLDVLRSRFEKLIDCENGFNIDEEDRLAAEVITIPNVGQKLLLAYYCGRYTTPKLFNLTTLKALHTFEEFQSVTTQDLNLKRKFCTIYMQNMDGQPSRYAIYNSVSAPRPVFAVDDDLFINKEIYDFSLRRWLDSHVNSTIGGLERAH